MKNDRVVGDGHFQSNVAGQVHIASALILLLGSCLARVSQHKSVAIFSCVKSGDLTMVHSRLLLGLLGLCLALPDDCEEGECAVSFRQLRGQKFESDIAEHEGEGSGAAEGHLEERMR